jgi:Zn-dependent protease with chaperone function
MFLALANSAKEKCGDIKFIFKNKNVSKAFYPVRNLLTIFPDAFALRTGGLFGILKLKSRFMLKKTGLRISMPVAFVLLLALCGWFLSLLFVVFLQTQRIHQQKQELNSLIQWKQQTVVEIQALRDRIRPMEQLGILKDTIE